MGLSPYCIMMKNASKAHTYNVRKSVVLEAQKQGVKPTARRWGISKNTVKTWLNRFKQKGNSGLKDQRAGPKHIPHKTSEELTRQVIHFRQQVPCYGPRRLRYFFNLPCSTGAIARILKSEHLTRKRMKKYEKKNDLRKHKEQWKTGTFIQMDVKHLYDIPNYWGQKVALKVDLPKYQYTMRDVKSGMVFLGYSDELSELNARTMVQAFLTHLSEKAPFSMNEVIIQTDNGSEFSGSARHFERAPFTQLIDSFGCKHKFIPPGCSNANADVESFHDTVEREFFDLTRFSSREDFMLKVESYRHFYNIKRPNYSKKVRTPLQIAQTDWPNSNFCYHQIIFRSLDLDKINFLLTNQNYNQRGQSLPGFPELILIFFIFY